MGAGVAAAGAALGLALPGSGWCSAGAAPGSLDGLGTLMGLAPRSRTPCTSSPATASAPVPPVGAGGVRVPGRDVHLRAGVRRARRPGVRIRRRRLGMGLRDRSCEHGRGDLCFFGGLARVGPSAASILSTLEPLVTVALAAAAFGESLGAVQWSEA